MYKCCCISVSILPNKWWMIQVLQFFSCEKVTKVIKVCFKQLLRRCVNTVLSFRNAEETTARNSAPILQQQFRLIFKRWLTAILALRFSFD